MATKLGAPVTTVQGWKKRGLIPQARHADILAAARREGIALDSSELAATDAVSGTRPDPAPPDPGKAVPDAAMPLTVPAVEAVPWLTM